MAIYRNVQLSFWTDNKVEDDFTPEDKYFYLYLLTNPQTNICGCYEVSYSQMTRQTGYNKETIIRLLERFDKVHNVIKFDSSTKEVLILNWHKYNWSRSEKVLTGVEKVAQFIKSESFKKYVLDVVNSIRNGVLPIGYAYPMVTSVSDSDTDSDTDSVSDTVNSIYRDTVNNINNTKDIDIIKDIINYLNTKCNTRYKHTTEDSKKHIRARLRDGYTKDDFFTVIDKKSAEWIGTEQEKYLRPATLFGTKFESYLNQKVTAKKEKTVFDEWRDA